MGGFGLRTQNWEGKSVINRFGRNKIYFVEEDHKYMSNMCVKESSALNFNQAVSRLMAKYRFFKKLPKILHINKIVILE